MKAGKHNVARLAVSALMPGLLFIACIVPAPAQTYVFNAAKFATGHNPQSVAIADFNRDGKSDLVVANYNDDTISVLLGSSAGNFLAKTDYAVGANPIAVTSGDFNRDGRPDVAVVNQNCPALPCPGPGSLSLLLGVGDGTFQAQQVTAIGEGPSALVAVDFNADGKLDAAVTNGQDNNVSVLLGNGAGAFARSDFDTGTNDKALAAGDFNGDGKLDLAAANKAKNNLSILLGNGDGTFQPHFLVASAVSPIAIVAADFNRDGKLDLATAHESGAQLSLLLGNGDGTFQPHSETGLVVANPALAISAPDFNGDGKPDLAATSLFTNSVSVLLSNGDGTFQAHVDYAAGSGPNSMAAGDLNGDRKADLVVADSVENTISVLPGDGKGAFQALVSTPAGAQPSAMVKADFNGDGNLDVAAPNWTAASVTVLLGNGSGGLTPAPVAPAVGNKPSAVAASDLNADGKPDLAVTNATDATVSVLLGNGDGSFQAQTAYAVRTKPTCVVTGDLNGDRRIDLAVVNQISQSVSVLLGNGDGTFRAAQNFPTGAQTTPAWAALGDFVNNGRLDLAVTGSGNNTVAVLLNHGDGTFTQPVAYPVGSAPSAVTARDFNHDGSVDLAVANSKSSAVSILLGNGNGTFTPAVNYPTAAGPLSVVAEDFTADGLDDLAVGFSSLGTGASNGISVLVGNGDGTFQPSIDHGTRFHSGGPTEAVVAGDFNGDGSVDLAAADQLAGIVSVFLNSPLASPFPGGLNFATQLVGSPSQPRTVTLNNSGSAALQITSVAASGDYLQTNTCTAPVEPGASCDISVVFAPTRAGARTGALTIADNSPSVTQRVALAGTGTLVQLNPANLDFGDQQVGTQSSVNNIQLTNTGSTGLSITTIAVRGSNAGDFAQTNNCPANLAAGASCTIDVTFSPTQVGSRRATVSISDNGGGSPQSVPLSGNGT